MIVLIDADSILYKICFSLEEKEEVFHLGFEDEELPAENYIIDIDVAKSTFDAMVKEILTSVIIEGVWEDLGEIEGYELWFSGTPDKWHPEGKEIKPNFRIEYSKKLTQEYKSNRKNMRLPAGIQELWAYAVSKPEAHIASGMEADDVVVYKKNTFPDKYFLCALDKDVLNQAVGKHYNYGKGVFHKTTQEEAVYFKYLQCLAGDPTDGYKGVPRIGEARGRKLLGMPGEKTEQELWDIVVKAYKDAKLTFTDAYVTMIMADMTQIYQDEDGFYRVSIFEPPFPTIEEGE
jgi:hypothetical protein